MTEQIIKAPIARPPAKDLSEYLSSEALKQEVAKVLPKYLTPERMLRVALTSCMRDTKIQQAAQHPVGKASLMNAMLQCFQAGLQLDGREAHLVPFWSSNDKCYKIQLIFDWKGLVALALRGGMKHVYADVVHEHDEFEAWVENGIKKLIHKVNWRVPRGEPLIWYCVSINPHDVFDYEVMTLQQVEDFRDRSKSKDGPWVSDFIEMGKKCPLRRMSKRWDLSADVREAMLADDDALPALGSATAEPKAFARPLFSSPAPQGAIEDKEEGPGEPEPVTEAPEGKEAPRKVVKKAELTQVEQIRVMLKENGIKEENFIDFLQATGVIAGEVQSLAAIALTEPETLNTILADRAGVLNALKGKAA